MSRKVTAILLSSTIVLGIFITVDFTIDFIPGVGGTTLYVNTTGSGGAYTSIQDAVGAAFEGDTIYVFNGTYYEYVVVNKTINLIGKNRENTVINGSGGGDVVRVEANWTNITGFTITGGGQLPMDAGIELYNVKNCKVGNNNVISNNYIGIYLSSSDSNNITDNNVILNKNDGLFIQSSNWNNISENTVYLNDGFGINLESSSNNKIIHNNLIKNANHAFDNSNNNWGNAHSFGGNYWHNWTAPDDDKDGFVDNPYNISGGSCKDFYPFSNIWGWNLGGCWHLDEGMGRYANDSSGNENNGILGPAPPSNAPQWVYGISKNALEFDGYDDYIDCGNDNSLNITDAITIEAWIKLNSLKPGEITSKPGAYYMEINHEYKLIGGIYDNSNWYRAIGNTTLSANRWYHVVFTYDGSDLRLYLDGNLDGESAHNGSISPFLRNNFYVGKQIFIDDFSSYAENSSGTLTYDFENYGIRPNQTVENGSYHFSGNTSDEPISIIRGLNATDYVVEARVKTTSLTGGAYICPRFLTVEDKYEIVLDCQWSNVLLNKVVNNVWTKIESVSLGWKVQNNTWYTLKGQITTEGNINRIKIWVNDVLYIDQNDGDLMNYTKLAILAFDWNNPFDIHFDDVKVYIPFNGTIDEVRIWDRALTPIEIQEQYRSFIIHSIFLYNGWNLISIPYIQSETNLGTVLSSITGVYDAVQWYNVSDISDPWKHNHASKPPRLNDLGYIDHTMGFWIHVTQPGDTIFLYNGTQPMVNQTITLHSGWNLVGYPSITSYNRTVGLNNLTFGTHIDAIWAYNATMQKWEEIVPSDFFESCRGYWMHAKVKCTWEVPL